MKLEDHEEGLIRNKKKYISGYFIRFGAKVPKQYYGNYQMNQVENLDFTEILKKIYKSTAAMWLFIECLERKDNMNMVVIKSALLTSTEQDRLKTGRKILIQEQIIKTVVKEIYMLNPYLVLTPNASLEPAREKWESI